MTELNLVMLAGRVRKDPSFTHPPVGIPICTFSVTVIRRFTMMDGTIGRRQVVVEVIACRRLGEIASQFVRKGSLILVVGMLENDPRLERRGKRLPRMRIAADSIQFLDRHGSASKA